MSSVRKRNVAFKNVTDEISSNINRSKENTNQPTSLTCKCLCVFLFLIALTAVVAVTAYYNAPFEALATEDFSKRVKLEGIFEVNKKLSQGSKKTGLLGAESIEEDKNGNLYTGLHDGRIVRIAPSEGIIGAGVVTNITNGIVSDAATSVKNAAHGRPLGLRLIGDTLFVADAIYGVYSVNIKTQEITSLVAPDSVDPPLGFADDLSLTKDGNFIYFSDGTSKHSYYSIGHFLLEGICDGRLLQYNIHTKQVRTVMSGICFANGVQISENEKFIFVSESFKYRLRVIDLMTWKMTRFVDLPIIPDNVRPSGKGSYWVAGCTPWTPSFGLLERLAWLRQILAGLFSTNTIAKYALKRHNILIELNEEGEILQTLHDPNGELIYGLTQATTLSDGRLVLGSFVADFLGFSTSNNLAIGAK